MQDAMLDINGTMRKESDMIPSLVVFMILWEKDKTKNRAATTTQWVDELSF